jgi:hypothetical protein
LGIKVKIIFFVVALFLSSSFTGAAHALQLKEDVENNWAEGAVETVLNLGIAQDCPDELFEPDQLVTRAEFTRMIVEAGWVTPAQKNGKPSFQDVGREHWAFPYVEAAAAAGIIAGEGNSGRCFEPGRAITRGEAAAIAGRLMAGEHLPGVPVNVAGRNYDWIAVMKEAGVFYGYPDGSLGENGCLTRAEACAVVLRVKEKLLAAEAGRERRWIASFQSPDGYIAMAGGREDIIPYFGNLTGVALAARPEYRDGIKKYLEWSLANLNYPDRWGLNGTIYDRRLEGSVLQSVYEYDSADSYAATLLSLAAGYERSAGNLDFIREHYRDLSTEAEVITTLQDSDGLIRAKPNLPVKYLMDNCECYRGLKDWSSLLAGLGFKELSDSYDSKAELIKKGILEQFWDENTAGFAWAVDREGGKYLPVAGKSYPGFFAQVYPVVFGVISPASGKAILAYQKLNEELPGWAGLDMGDPFPWTVIGYGALLMDDLPRADQFFKNCRFSYIKKGRLYPWSTFEDAFYVRACDALREKLGAGLKG